MRRAAATLEEALKLASMVGDHWLIGETLEGLGHVALASGAGAEARARFGASAQLYRRAGDLRAVRALEGLAAAIELGGDASLALRLLETAASVRAEWGYPRSAHDEVVVLSWVERARSAVPGMERRRAAPGDLDTALAEALLFQPRVSSSRPGALSLREQEVLRLLARGESNEAIARDLVISVRTVERHLTHIYAKLGARGRADAIVHALS